MTSLDVQHMFNVISESWNAVLYGRPDRCIVNDFITVNKDVPKSDNLLVIRYFLNHLGKLSFQSCHRLAYHHELPLDSGPHHRIASILLETHILNKMLDFIARLLNIEEV